MLLAAMALVGIITICAIFIGQRHVEHGYRAAADALAESKADVASLSASVSASYMFQQAFLLEKEMASTDKFKAAVSEGRGVLASLRRSATPELAAQLDQLSIGLTAYEAAFDTLVKNNQDLGLDQDNGLQGAMRSAVHSIEGRLDSVDDTAIRASM